VSHPRSAIAGINFTVGLVWFPSISESYQVCDKKMERLGQANEQIEQTILNKWYPRKTPRLLHCLLSALLSMERVKGIEPSSQAWEAHVLPLNHTRVDDGLIDNTNRLRQQGKASPNRVRWVGRSSREFASSPLARSPCGTIFTSLGSNWPMIVTRSSCAFHDRVDVCLCKPSGPRPDRRR
jgi:hypothetical protein